MSRMRPASLLAATTAFAFSAPTLGQEDGDPVVIHSGTDLFAPPARTAPIDTCFHRQSASEREPVGYWCVAHFRRHRDQTLVTLRANEADGTWEYRRDDDVAYTARPGDALEVCAVAASNFDGEHDGWAGYAVYFTDNGTSTNQAVTFERRCASVPLKAIATNDEVLTLGLRAERDNAHVTVFGFWRNRGQ